MNKVKPCDAAYELEIGGNCCRRGDIYRCHNCEVTWKVIKVTPALIQLTGPGPCRSIKTVSRKQFEKHWIKVNV